MLSPIFLPAGLGQRVAEQSPLNPGFDRGVQNAVNSAYPGAQQSGQMSFLAAVAPATQQPQYAPVSQIGDAIRGVQDKLATGEVKINEINERRRQVLSKMYEVMAARGGLAPETAQRLQQDPKEALAALGLTALAASLGARNAGAAGNQFMQARQAQMAQGTQDLQGKLDTEYLRRKSELDAQLQSLNMEYEDAGQQLSQSNKDQTALQSDLTQLQQEEQRNYRNDRTLEGAMARANLSAETQIKLKELAIQNPAIMQNYAVYEQYLGPDAALSYLQNEAQKQGVQNDATKAKTETENALRQPRVDKIKADIQNQKDMIQLRRDELNAKVDHWATQIDTEAEAQAFKRANGIIDADIDALKADIKIFKSQEDFSASLMKQYEKEVKLATAQNDLAALAEASKGYADAKASKDYATEQRMEAEKRIAEKTKEKAQGKAGAPSGAGYANIKFSSRAQPDYSSGKINRAVLTDVDTAAGNLGFSVTIGTAMSGHSPTTRSGNTSRHSVGNAVDITHINGVPVSTPAGKKLADQLVAELVKQGAIRNRESGNQRAVLWQMQDHYDHIHYSNRGS